MKTFERITPDQIKVGDRICSNLWVPNGGDKPPPQHTLFWKVVKVDDLQVYITGNGIVTPVHYTKAQHSWWREDLYPQLKYDPMQQGDKDEDV